MSELSGGRHQDNGDHPLPFGRQLSCTTILLLFKFE